MAFHAIIFRSMDMAAACEQSVNGERIIAVRRVSDCSCIHSVLPMYTCGSGALAALTTMLLWF